MIGVLFTCLVIEIYTCDRYMLIAYALDSTLAAVNNYLSMKSLYKLQIIRVNARKEKHAIKKSFGISYEKFFLLKYIS